MKLKVLGKRIFVELQKKQDKTKSGIVLPDTTDDFTPTKIGIVKYVGKGVDLRVGTKVLFRRGQDVNVRGKEYVVLNEDDILATL